MPCPKQSPRDKNRTVGTLAVTLGSRVSLLSDKLVYLIPTDIRSCVTRGNISEEEFSLILEAREVLFCHNEELSRSWRFSTENEQGNQGIQHCPDAWPRLSP